MFRLYGIKPPVAVAPAGKERLPKEAQAIVDKFDDLEKRYAAAKEKAGSEKSEDVKKAADDIEGLREQWMVIKEYPKTFDGFEERRKKAEQRLDALDKGEPRQIREQAFTLEMREMNLRNRSAPTPAPIVNPVGNSPKSTPESGPPEGVSEEEWLKKLEEDDPSEHERYLLLKKKKLEAKAQENAEPKP